MSASTPKKSILSSIIQKMMTPTRTGSVVEDTEDVFKEIRKRLCTYKTLQAKIGFDEETKQKQIDGLFQRMELLVDQEIETKREQNAMLMSQIKLSIEDNGLEFSKEFLESKSLTEIKDALDKKIKDIQDEEDRKFKCMEIMYDLTKLRREFKFKAIVLPQADGSLEVLKQYEEELKQKLEYTKGNRETFEQFETRNFTTRKLSLALAEGRNNVGDRVIENYLVQINKLDETLSKNKKVYIHGLTMRARIQKETLLKEECLDMSRRVEYKTHEDVCSYIQTPIPVPATTRSQRKILDANGEREGNREEEDSEDQW